MTNPTGLRARKKAATRLAISQVATRLFIERGFDAVTVAEVAAAADVSVNTLFNYFSTKEDLFFDLAEEVIDAPSRMVRDRAPGETATEALRRGLRDVVTGAPERLFSEQIVAFVRTVDQSPALRARTHLIFEESEGRLAATLREVGEADPHVLAGLVMGLVRVLARTFRDQVHDRAAPTEARATILRQADEGFAILLRGLQRRA